MSFTGMYFVSFKSVCVKQSAVWKNTEKPEKATAKAQKGRVRGFFCAETKAQAVAISRKDAVRRERKAFFNKGSKTLQSAEKNKTYPVI